MKQRDTNTAFHHKEYQAELLKERIYATLAVLAVLISIDAEHYSPVHAALLVSGTVISLWAASIVATQMSRRVIFKGELDHTTEREYQLRKHAPMLAAMVFPLFMLLLSILQVISLSVAINTSVVGALLLLVGWSVLSAKSLKVTKIPLVALISLELLIGLGVVGLKVVLGH